MKLDPAHLSIKEVAARTSISTATLRAWEARYGFPVPERLGGGHRRYTDLDCRILGEVKRARGQGMPIPDAIAFGRRAVRESGSSVFTGLRFRHPHLGRIVLPEPFMLAISRAMERTMVDHHDGIVVGTFQRVRAWRVAEPRWLAMAESAHTAVVFADFASAERSGSVWQIPIGRATPLYLEWSVICDSPTWCGCLVGRELPSDEERRPPRRVFEAMWSLEPEVVRDAARIAVTIAEPEVPEIAQSVGARLRELPVADASTVRDATLFTNRIFDNMVSAARASARTLASEPGRSR